MTTVAVRGRVMAADSQFTAQGLRLTGQKLYTVGTAVLGFAGNVSSALVFLDWYENRESRRPDLGNECDFEALVLSADGLEYWDASLRPHPIKGDFHAIGSGSHLALGAMAMGANAEQAVQIAAQFDVHTGGSIIRAELPMPKPKRGRRRASKG